jgi:hypothetical protein
VLAVTATILPLSLGSSFASANSVSGSDTHVPGFEQDYYLYYNQQWCGTRSQWNYQITETDAQWYRSSSSGSVSSAYYTAVENNTLECGGTTDFLVFTYGPFQPYFACGDYCWTRLYKQFYSWPYTGWKFSQSSQVGGRDNGDAYLSGTYQGSMCVVLMVVGTMAC